jgi:hypothetical protein
MPLLKLDESTIEHVSWVYNINLPHIVEQELSKPKSQKIQRERDVRVHFDQPWELLFSLALLFVYRTLFREESREVGWAKAVHVFVGHRESNNRRIEF